MKFATDAACVDGVFCCWFIRYIERKVVSMDDLQTDKNKKASARTPSRKTMMRRSSNCVVVAACFAVLAACSDGGASAPSVAAPLPDAPSAVAELYTLKCGECHFRPQPASHTAPEWISVVRRMDNHRIMKGKGALTEAETKQILDYLAKHAKGD